ncbi:MAG TPA: Hsp70 family protein, partial [Acidimicrobiales bacterium]|nr:Hsp70 family protein [Acidimicrobiales bacterium]
MTDNCTTALGIDLGTTFSVVAQVNQAGIPTALPNAEGSPTTPSVVLFDGDEVVVGAVAREAIAADPEFVVQLAKRRIGSEWAFEYGDVAYRAEHISALIAKKLLQDARRLVGHVTETVVTVPAYFNDAMRAATRQAVEMAGSRVLGVLSEPTAAAIAFGYDQRPEHAQGVVIDLGGGTFDVTVLEIDREHLTVRATGGDAYLGGANFDKVLFDHFVAQFEHAHGIDIRDPEALSVEDFTHVSQDWLLRADRVKHDLSAREHTAVQLQAVGLSHRFQVTRQAFEALSRVLLDEVNEKMLEVVQMAGCKPSDMSVLLSVGGATRMPMVQERIRAIFGRDPDTSVRPDEAVALGASVEAARLQLEEGTGLVLDQAAREYLEAMTVTDVSAHSLGVSVFTGTGPSGTKHLEILLARNSPLPQEASKVFFTRHPGETRVVVPILEG